MIIWKIIYIPAACLLLILLTSCDYQKIVIPDTPGTSDTLLNGLVAFYNFNNNLQDQSGKGHNGTAFGGYYKFEINGNGTYSFNGGGDYIKVSNESLLNPTNAITISLWFKPVNYYGTGYDALVLKPFTSHSPPYYQYILGIAGSHGLEPYNFAFNVNLNGVNTGINSGSNTWIEGYWYYVVGLYDGVALKLYVNGTLKNSLNTIGSILSYNTDLFIAKQANISSTTPGTLDNVRIYNRALSEKAIKELYEKYSK
jgi:hypothetical protein